MSIDHEIITPSPGRAERLRELEQQVVAMRANCDALIQSIRVELGLMTSAERIPGGPSSGEADSIEASNTVSGFTMIQQLQINVRRNSNNLIPIETNVHILREIEEIMQSGIMMGHTHLTWRPSLAMLGYLLQATNHTMTMDEFCQRTGYAASTAQQTMMQVKKDLLFTTTQLEYISKEKRMTLSKMKQQPAAVDGDVQDELLQMLQDRISGSGYSQPLELEKVSNVIKCGLSFLIKQKRAGNTMISYWDVSEATGPLPLGRNNSIYNMRDTASYLSYILPREWRAEADNNKQAITYGARNY